MLRVGDKDIGFRFSNYKDFRDVSPIIRTPILMSAQIFIIQTLTMSLPQYRRFDTQGGCQITLYGQYFGPPQQESDLCVTIGPCLPFNPDECGQPCSSGGVSVKPDRGTLRNFDDNAASGLPHSHSQCLRAGVFNELFV